MEEKCEEFRLRGSNIFRSLRPKREKSASKKKTSSSKSMFSSLLLANYEQQLQFDPHSTYSCNLSLDNLRTNSREILTQKYQQKSVKNTKSDNISVNGKDETKSVEVCETWDHKTTIIPVDPYIFEVYEDVLCNIQQYLNKNSNLDIDIDFPTINEDTAIKYIKDAFEINDSKHEEILEKMSQVKVDTTKENENKNMKRKSFCVLSIQLFDYEALRAYTYLLKILLKHELDTSQTPHNYWLGNFSFLGRSVLALYSKAKHLTEGQLTLCRLSAYAEIHQKHPLNLAVFVNLLNSVIEVLQHETFIDANKNLMTSAKLYLPSCFGMATDNDNDDLVNENTQNDQTKSENELIIEMFWRATKILSECFFKFIEEFYGENNLDFIKEEILCKLMIIQGRIEKIDVPEELMKKISFDEVIKRSITTGTDKFINKAVRFDHLKNENIETEIKLNELIKLMEESHKVYEFVVEKVKTILTSEGNSSYKKHLYDTFDKKLSNIIKPIVIKINKSNKVDNLPESITETTKKLFQLYILLKKFSDEGLESFGCQDFHMKEYFRWFDSGSSRTARTSVFNALARIERAIAGDNLKSLNSSTKYSTSAVDTVTILGSIKNFWNNMKLLNVTKNENIDKNVVSDICRFSMIYFEKISNHVEKSDAMRNLGIFKVPVEVCICVCNISHVCQNLQFLFTEHSLNNSRLCEITLEYAKLKSTNLIQISIDKMIPSMRKLILEGADIVKKESDIGDRFLTYIEDSWTTLNEDLYEADYKIARNLLWKTILNVFSDLIQKSLEVQRPPIFYSNLRIILHASQDVFMNSTMTEKTETLVVEKVKQLDYLLERYGLNTAKLIHQYYKDRYTMQQHISKSPFHPYGILSVHCHFKHNILKLEILNAKNLVPIGNNRKCDSFVKINIVPADDFLKFQDLKTKVDIDTHFPLYEQSFDIDLTSQQRSLKDAIIVFTIKGKSLFTSSQCLAEAFLKFNDIPEMSHEQKIQKQIHLTLTRLQNDGMESLKALQQRSQAGDKQAKDFLSKIKALTVNTSTKTNSPVTIL
ncbi:CLUMA_CG002134, isoform A [Clunio marinus]|uniref:CLUMA_CG002134, isoform A n=1 Tax=Clunio marinus TaxID=568069 RepID=A0A1J1HK04_9DIPT|nr:CLUMA_CG002134, isoform A [Clunio marinus]